MRFTRRLVRSSAVAAALSFAWLASGAPRPVEDGKPRGDASGARPLLLVTADEGLDWARLGGLVVIHDHYYEKEAGRLRHRLLGVPRGDDLAALDALPLSYRVLDPDARRADYLWVAGLDPKSPRLKEPGAVRFLLGRSGAPALVAAPAGAGEGERAVATFGDARIRRVDMTSPIRPEWIAPPAPGRSRGQLRQSPRDGRRDATVEAMARGVDADGCRLILEQLTGAAPITLGSETRTIRSRFAASDDMGPLTAWLAAEFRRSGLDARVETFRSPVHGRDLPQVVATIPGTDLKEELVIVTAHLDAVRNTPGADDNASGIAAVVGAARRLAGHAFRRTIQFVAFNDEEQGLVGSTDFARRLASEGRTVAGVLNLDMVAYDRDRDGRIQLQSNGTPACDALADQLAAAASAYGLDLAPVKVVDPEESSDYAAFWRVGFPAINIGDEYFLCDGDCSSPPGRGVIPPAGDFTPCYHRPCDRLDDPGFRQELVVEVCRMVVAGAANIAEIVPTPAGNADGRAGSPSPAPHQP